ncbi:MAG: AlkA N-terminal domain-containing protein [Woeseiaceae bacterium]|nr:AlkA N-terminal domain-containing protein [Woeseiaceae bacterium]
MLESNVYERARLARDPRFDGQFYVGVTSTGIYCRPICPANAPKRENVRFFPSAAAASEAGFRPCLRCRPECAPGTPAWNGTSTTVRRGLRLISGGALDDGNVEYLAERLGVTSRHLRRLFTRHVGASPLAVAHTQRLHFAKRLIDETTLPMARIAEAAGYGSIRRFNDAFRKTYGRSPRELRKAGEESPLTGTSATLTVRLPYRPPFDWDAMCRFFVDRATPGVEAIVGKTYFRTISTGGDHGVVEIAPDRRDGYLSLTLHSVNTNALFETVQKAREVFDLDAPIGEITETLRGDPALARLLRSCPGIRVPGSWDGFELTVRAILGQQVSVKAATTLAGRIAAKYGARLELPGDDLHPSLTHLFPLPEQLKRARFNNIGLVRARADTIRRVAAAVHSGELQFDIAGDPAALCEALVAIKGVGAWTAQYVAMRAMKNPDAFPASDLGLLKASAGCNTPNELQERAEKWRPWRAYAAMLLWSSLPGSGG